MSGAGVLPFCVHDGRVLFLFHRTFIGKKVGYLIDFGGAIIEDRDGDDMMRAASRELSEETGGLIIQDDLTDDDFDSVGKSTSEADMQRNPTVIRCAQRILDLMEQSNNRGLLWEKTLEGYHLYLMEIPYFDLERLNEAFWKAPKRREFVWVPVEDILAGNTEQPLFIRVAAIQGIMDTFREIKQRMEKK